jgi:hypothetical protein
MRGVTSAAVAYDPLPPSAPRELCAEASKDGVTLTWMHPSRELLASTCTARWRWTDDARQHAPARR